MLYTAKCPYCGAMQKGLDLKETSGSVVCFECEMQFEVREEESEIEIKKEETVE